MTKRVQRSVILTAILTGIFLLYTVLIKVVDVQAIGPMNTSVGFAAVNGWFFRTIGTSDLFYTISKIGGIISLATAFLFACIGAWQLYQRRSLMKVDKNLLAMGGIFLLVILLYIFFDKVPVNYRPVLEDGALEASFPSTHTMLACVIMCCAMIECKEVVTRKDTLQYITWFCWAVIILTVISRLLSGVHWFTDIIGGILISLAIVSLYYTLVLAFRPKRTKKPKTKENPANS